MSPTSIFNKTQNCSRLWSIYLDLLHISPNIWYLLAPGIPSPLLKPSALWVSKVSLSTWFIQPTVHTSIFLNKHTTLSLLLLQNVVNSVLYYLCVCLISFIRLQVSRGQEKCLIHIKHSVISWSFVYSNLQEVENKCAQIILFLSIKTDWKSN